MRGLYELVGTRVSATRLACDIDQATLATRTHLTPETVAAIERGRHRMHLETLYVLAKALEVSPGALLPDAEAVPLDEVKWLRLDDGDTLLGMLPRPAAAPDAGGR